ncbi:MAG: hypothetical protein IJO67_01570 [Clostridia bacterium]|nr:hypothetical protein [Clostridia bacterium]
MEDFAIIILGIIISLVARAKKKAKQEAAKTKKVVYTAPAKKEEQPTLDSSWEIPRMESVMPAAPVMGMEGTDTCHDYMLPSQPKPLNIHPIPAPVIGTEGVDACHDYMLKETPALQRIQPAESGLSPEEARDLMRGIILSEIMARPQQRFAARRR